MSHPRRPIVMYFRFNDNHQLLKRGEDAATAVPFLGVSKRKRQTAIRPLFLGVNRFSERYPTHVFL
jgi:hypothetical protein